MGHKENYFVVFFGFLPLPRNKDLIFLWIYCAALMMPYYFTNSQNFLCIKFQSYFEHKMVGTLQVFSMKRLETLLDLDPNPTTAKVTGTDTGNSQRRALKSRLF
jgi:hypothetical protein